MASVEARQDVDVETRVGPTPKHSVVVVTGPSGVGKNYVLRTLSDRYGGRYSFSVSHTTRKPRPGELDGTDYHFVSHEEFQELAQADAFVEQTHFCGNNYGTSFMAIERASQDSTCCLLDLDLQGAVNLKQRLPEAFLIYIAPPSMKVLEQRLRGRESETEEQIEARLERAKEDMRLFHTQHKALFDAVIVNGTDEEPSVSAVEDLHTLVYRQGMPASRNAFLPQDWSAESFIAMAAATAEKSDAVKEAYGKMTMDDLVSLCKRRGFVFQSGDIYGGNAGFYDYGPLGAELKRELKAAWWRTFVQQRDDMVGLDSAIIGLPRMWEASGHVGGFSDPMVDCKESKQRFRADQILCAPVIDATGKELGWVMAMDDATAEEKMKKAAGQLLKKAGGEKPFEPLNIRDLTEIPEEDIAKVPSPATGNVNTLTPPRDFNLMFQTNVGPVVADSSVAYLRPETAQGIFTNFKNVVDTSRVKVPFGIAQIGKAFRNEITPRNFIFRSREFEQMEIEYFIREDDWKECHQQWLDHMREFLLHCGLRPELIGTEVHADEKLAHYARACTDLTFTFPFGEQELLGVAARGAYDLGQHAEFSGKKLEYTEQKEKFVPHVIEPSLGVDRLFLAVMASAYCEDEVDGEKRTVLKFAPSIAPIKCLVLPLVKNKEPIMNAATALYKKLQQRWNVTFDQTGAIGRRYRRGDEAGVPFCITIDFESIEEGPLQGTYTIRDRDTCEQQRMTEEQLMAYLTEKINGY